MWYTIPRPYVFYSTTTTSNAVEALNAGMLGYTNYTKLDSFTMIVELHICLENALETSWEIFVKLNMQPVNSANSGARPIVWNRL